MTGSVSGSAATVCLATLAELLCLTTKGSLIAGKMLRSADQGHKALSLHFAILGSRERATVVLQFNDTLRGLSCHVVDSVLVT